MIKPRATALRPARSMESLTPAQGLNYQCSRVPLTRPRPGRRASPRAFGNVCPCESSSGFPALAPCPFCHQTQSPPLASAQRALHNYRRHPLAIGPNRPPSAWDVGIIRARTNLPSINDPPPLYCREPTGAAIYSTRRAYRHRLFSPASGRHVLARRSGVRCRQATPTLRRKRPSFSSFTCAQLGVFASRRC